MTPFWVAREPPLAPAAALATGAVCARLVQRLLADSDDRLAALQGVAAPDLIIVRGPTDGLPWVDGIAYLGELPESAGVFVPTTLRPSGITESAALWAQAVRRTGGAGPLAWLPDGAVIPLSAARPLDRTVLEAWRP